MGETTFYWVGTGSAFNPVLGHTSFLVSGAGSRRLLVDCGATVPLKLVELERIGEVTDIVLTHMHADHIGGLEGLGFYLHFLLGRVGDQRPVLHLASEEFAHDLWNNALRAGMSCSQSAEGEAFEATMETYFRVNIGTRIEVEGLPALDLRETAHIAGMENYGILFDNGVYYSGDTTELPPHDPELIFQDCQMVRFGPGDVHISYDALLKGLPPEVRRKTYLTHLNATHSTRDPIADGFAGYVLPGQVFRF